MENRSVIYIVDNEDTFREGLAQLLQSTGMDVEHYPSADEFLKNYNTGNPCCLVLDIDMPGTNGLELQQILIERKIKIPIIFITGYGDVPKSVQALKAGAVDFLEKPFRTQVLMELIQTAIARDLGTRKSDGEKSEIEALYNNLTGRLKEIMHLIVSGYSNKEIGEKINISHRTVEIHRKKIMSRMKAKSLPDLVKMAAICGADIHTGK